ncbi:hypothetical protein LSH36_790g01025 [Paralvinella palmiformis]|uniref:CARD domain-containing protein n=1 Tax=Paralvinella palmiformis TaxID=53620 RepID=A0AAD9J010_9ANNE|nr:hypothetical protein LSH36_790g01025 [Paralvinella palmiformis]
MRVFLCEKLEPDRYYALLRQAQVIDENDEQEIRSLQTRLFRAELLLDKLEKRDDGYDQLVKVLHRDRTQHYILEMVKETFNKLWQRTCEYEIL